MATSILLASFALVARPAEQLEELDTVLVAGEQPGPGLWKITRDDHVLWVLASSRYRPRGAVWNTRRIDARIAESQEVLLAPQVQVEPSIGFFKMLTLVPAIPAALNLDENPGGAKLKDVLPPATHARWLALRDKYYVKFGKKGDVEDVEKSRPALAITLLHDWAFIKSGLLGGPLDGLVTNLAQNHKVPIHRLPTIFRAVKLEGSPRRMIKEALKVLPAELACFERSLSTLETDIELTKQRANAWSLGDIPKLRELHGGSPRGDDCISASMFALAGQQTKDAASARKMLDSFTWHEEQGRVQAQRDWVAAARVALDNNPSTFAMLPVEDVFRADGHIEALRKLGYTVEEPL